MEGSCLMSEQGQVGWGVGVAVPCCPDQEASGPDRCRAREDPDRGGARLCL